MPWNMIVIPITPGTSTVANADSERAPPPPTLWPIRGNTYRNTNTSRNGWISVRTTNSHLFFHSTTRSRRISARRATRLAASTERVGAISMRGRCAGTAAAGELAGAALTRAAPCR